MENKDVTDKGPVSLDEDALDTAAGGLTAASGPTFANSGLKVADPDQKKRKTGGFSIGAGEGIPGLGAPGPDLPDAY